ncbi:hypothetical protein C7E25_24120 [Stenotrophomonas maltophilia]|nr:hypothetical protein C7E25_24120 [Stenotrophomonas maltophilia]
MGRMRFRIDGVLHKVFEVPPAVMTAVAAVRLRTARLGHPPGATAARWGACASASTACCTRCSRYRRR